MNSPSITNKSNNSSGEKTDSRFNYLPGDILRLFGLYLHVPDITNLCELNEKIKNSVSENDVFLCDLGCQRLSKYPNRFRNHDIFADISSINTVKEAFFKGYLEKVKYLRAQAMDHFDVPTHETASRCDYDNAGYLLIAAQNGYLDIAEYLADTGTYIQSYSSEALLQAIGKGHLNIVEYVIPRGADIHIYHDAPLILAISLGHLAIVKYLVSQGADINTRNRCALEIAKKHNHQSIEKYLESLIDRHN